MDSEMLWSKKPIKKRSKKTENSIKEALNNINADDKSLELVSRTQMPVELTQDLIEVNRSPTRYNRKRTQWSVAILVLIIASIVARVFLV